MHAFPIQTGKLVSLPCHFDWPMNHVRGGGERGGGLTSSHRADMQYRLDNLTRADFWILKGACTED